MELARRPLLIHSCQRANKSPLVYYVRSHVSEVHLIAFDELGYLCTRTGIPKDSGRKKIEVYVLTVALCDCVHGKGQHQLGPIFPTARTNMAPDTPLAVMQPTFL